MFIGHFAVGLGAKAAAPKTSLGTLFLAAQFLDLLWPTLLVLGMERVVIEPGNTKLTPLDFVHYPISHSLLMVIGWGILFGAVYWQLTGRRNASIVLGAVVVSHWLLDLLVHGPDLPLYPGKSPELGFGLWNIPGLAIGLETLIFAAGLWLYLRSTRPLDRTGSIGFWALIVFLVSVYLMNFFGPPPPNESAIAWAGHLQWLFVLWAWWVDKHREPKLAA